MRIISFIALVLLLGCQENFGDIRVFRSIQGEVLNEGSLEAISGAVISTNPLSELQISDEDGRFVLDSLTSEFYSIRVTAENYLPTLTTFNLIELERAGLVILMERDSAALSSPPSVPFNPTPSDNSTSQELSVSLSWRATDDQDSLTYRVSFFRPNNVEPEILLDNSQDTTVNTNSLQFNATYFWQVEVTDRDGNRVLGPAWSFKTKPFPDSDFRYTLVREVDGFDQVFLGNDNREVIQVTNDLTDHWRPTISPQRDKIAFIALDQGATHLYTMDKNGSNIRRITSSKPLRTKDLLRAPFSWSDNGDRIVYMDFDKILSIGKDGAGVFEYGFDAEGRIITGIDHSSISDGKLVITTENATTKDSRMYIYDIAQDTQRLILNELDGQFSHAQFSPSGNRIVFSFNRSSDFSTFGIPLNKRMYYYDLISEELVALSENKPGGTADSNPRFARNGDFIAFINGQSDGIGISNAFLVQIDGNISSSERDTLFQNSNLIDWE